MELSSAKQNRGFLLLFLEKEEYSRPISKLSVPWVGFTEIWWLYKETTAAIVE
jgi:hypothetical protein